MSCYDFVHQRKRRNRAALPPLRSIYSFSSQDANRDKLKGSRCQRRCYQTLLVLVALSLSLFLPCSRLFQTCSFLVDARTKHVKSEQLKHTARAQLEGNLGIFWPIQHCFTWTTALAYLASLPYSQRTLNLALCHQEAFGSPCRAASQDVGQRLCSLTFLYGSTLRIVILGLL